MAKNDWKGVADARPCASTDPEANQTQRDTESVSWKGTGSDSRPSSGTDSQEVNVGGGSFTSKAGTVGSR